MKILVLLLILLVLNNSINSAILRIGKPLRWEKSLTYLNDVRSSGIKQFINHYIRSKDIITSSFKWGDELEYGIFIYDNSSKRYDLSLRGSIIREELEELEKTYQDLGSGCTWQPEYGAWMVEAVPRDPYGGFVSDLLLVEKNMQLRRLRLHAALKDNEVAPSLSNFPMLGCDGYKHSQDTKGPIANSEYISDSIINPHPRFGALTRNIRQRKEGNVDIKVPYDNDQVLKMDAMAFGMGCCCLQVTIQAQSDDESRFLHDQLAIMAPIMLAVSASTPIHKGHLVNTDTRWDVISQAVDDRRKMEMGIDDGNQVVQPSPQLAGNGIKRLKKSRYSSISRYITKTHNDDETNALRKLNDIDAGIDEESYKMLLDAGIDESLASHIAHLFTRDPLVIFEDSIYLDDNKALDHFENIQSTNWRSMRWKTPCLEMGYAAEKAIDSKVNDKDTSSNMDLESAGPGWRVEFRPLEVQLTDFENAAFSLFVILLARATLAMGFNFYIPMSCLEENMDRSAVKDAVLKQKFWVNKGSLLSSSRSVPDLFDINLVELTVDEIINGKDNEFMGIIPAILNYLEALKCNQRAIDRIKPYLDHISLKAAGKLPTTAAWIRNFVESHADYKGDSKVPVSVANDLIKTADDIGMGRLSRPDLTGDACIKRLTVDEVHDAYLSSSLEDCKSSLKSSTTSSSPLSSDITINSAELKTYLNTTILQ